MIVYRRPVACEVFTHFSVEKEELNYICEGLKNIKHYKNSIVLYLFLMKYLICQDIALTALTHHQCDVPL